MNIDDIRAGAVQHRAATIEDVDEGSHELLVKAAPYEVWADIGGQVDEMFRRSAFARAANAPHRLGVWSLHNGPLVGRGVEVDDRDDGIWIRARLGRSQSARDMLSDVQDKILTDPSVEFRPLPSHMLVQQRGARYRVEHARAHLLGFAMVPEGAYAEEAFVEYARDNVHDKRDELLAWLIEYRNRRP